MLRKVFNTSVAFIGLDTCYKHLLSISDDTFS